MTSASIAHCKKALEEAGGDLKKAAAFLRKHGLEIAAKKAERTAKEGRIEVYIHHGNKIGVLLEINCESDFVAKNSDFIQFAKASGVPDQCKMGPGGWIERSWKDTETALFLRNALGSFSKEKDG
jgi:translation elongation factor Ts